MVIVCCFYQGFDCTGQNVAKCNWSQVRTTKHAPQTHSHAIPCKWESTIAHTINNMNNVSAGFFFFLNRTDGETKTRPNDVMVHSRLTEVPGLSFPPVDTGSNSRPQSTTPTPNKPLLKRVNPFFLYDNEFFWSHDIVEINLLTLCCHIEKSRHICLLLMFLVY